MAVAIDKFGRLAPPKARQIIKFASALAARRDAACWYAVLSRIHRRSVMYDLDLHNDDPYIKAVKHPGGTILFQVGGPYADFTANLAMSDKALADMFHLWLRIAREQVPTPRTTRGPDALNSKVDSNLFARWRDARIVEYAYLLIWRAKLDPAERAKYGVETLADWIKRGVDTEGHGEKKIRVTREVLQHAMSCLPMLGGERELELLRVGDVRTRKAIADSITTDVSRDPRAFLSHLKRVPRN